MKKNMIFIGAITLLNACATTNVTQFQGPDGTLVKTVKCSSDNTKCFNAAKESCPGEGTYSVISSASRAGGLAADILPGPVTWYYMTYVCGTPDGLMPEFKFTGQQYVPQPPKQKPTVIIREKPSSTTCTGYGNSITCNSY